MDHAGKGSLRKSIPNIVKSEWYYKLSLLSEIIGGLDTIHQLNLVHGDFHDGNILNHNNLLTFVSYLGLCKPVESYQTGSKGNHIYGILPFVAPEVLRYKPHTSASDIYSFSMIMWKFTSGVSPFGDRAHDLHLGLSICKGERPEILPNTPQCYGNLMKKCWDEDPNQRPKASEIFKLLRDWYDNIDIFEENIDKDFKNDILEFQKADQDLKIIKNQSIIKPHSEAYQMSHLLDFTKDLNEILNEENDNQGSGLHQTGIQNIGNYLNKIKI